MSGDLPELVVDGDPDDWVHVGGGRAPHSHGPRQPRRNTVRVDGPLPTVTELDPHTYTEKSARARLSRNPGLVMREIDGKWYTGQVRPLRVGDRVLLATIDRVSYAPGGYQVPFATATVAKVLPVTSETTDAASVQIAPTGAAFELDEYTPGEPWTGGRRIEVPPGTKAGDWLITVTDVEVLP